MYTCYVYHDRSKQNKREREKKKKKILWIVFFIFKFEHAYCFQLHLQHEPLWALAPSKTTWTPSSSHHVVSEATAARTGSSRGLRHHPLRSQARKCPSHTPLASGHQNHRLWLGLHRRTFEIRIHSVETLSSTRSLTGIRVRENIFLLLLSSLILIFTCTWIWRTLRFHWLLNIHLLFSFILFYSLLFLFFLVFLYFLFLSSFSFLLLLTFSLISFPIILFLSYNYLILSTTWI